MNDRSQLSEHLKFFEEIGVKGVSQDPKWNGRLVDLKNSVDGINLKSFSQNSGSGHSEDTLAGIREELGDCERCRLHKGRTKLVFGAGDSKAELMFVGEAPGHDEDIQGIPFVGRAGQLLTKIIESIGLSREKVYIANVIKCRPPENRNPEADEINTCEPFLLRQIDAIKPKVIVALGTFAAQTLLQAKDPISRMRGRVYEYRGVKLVPTFHPAFLLRSPSRKRDVWEDMKKVSALLRDVSV